jgi:hypothetical protein
MPAGHEGVGGGRAGQEDVGEVARLLRGGRGRYLSGFRRGCCPMLGGFRTLVRRGQAGSAESSRPASGVCNKPTPPPKRPPPPRPKQTPTAGSASCCSIPSASVGV